ncbi:M23 family metallopeptidase [Clostridium sp. MSJ-11]|uniref:M23 family metallopeptidase n=1 Tax=Clostridium mobile TaxID=2841512 RepID=A0ABS6EED9_9CLOT|nr:M23 family metallopeptidase [Clostridium mobile]MBU5483563.1 M23 family metallopeptidase [Clostridium mobile]
MGSYNSQYEEYYRNLKKRKEVSNNYSNRGKNQRSISHYITKRIIRDLVGATMLVFLVLMCKVIVTPKTQLLYNYSKEIVNKNTDISSLGINIKNFSFKELEEKATNIIESAKSKITGKKTMNQKIGEEFILPVNGSVTSGYGYRTDPIDNKNKFHHGTDISVKEGTEVKAAYNGKIKDCGEDPELGNYILIDHGEGIETRYAHLSSVDVKKDGTVIKGEVIGKSGKTGKVTGEHLHFELLFMGESRNPENYLSIK